jgi:hypothetical protein
MSIKIKNSLILTTAALMLFVFTIPNLAFADCDNPGSVKEETQCGANGAAGQSSGSSSSIDQTITNIINVLSAVVGVVAVIMILIAGFRYITSSGSEQTVASAKKTLLYAIIGLMIAILAQVIARFVINKTT